MEPVGYDDAGGNTMGPERQHYGFRHNMELRFETPPSSMNRGAGECHNEKPVKAPNRHVRATQLLKHAHAQRPGRTADRKGCDHKARDIGTGQETSKYVDGKVSEPRIRNTAHLPAAGFHKSKFVKAVGPGIPTMGALPSTNPRASVISTSMRSESVD